MSQNSEDVDPNQGDLRGSVEMESVNRGDLFNSAWPVLSQDFLAHAHANVTCRNRQLHDVLRAHVAFLIEDFRSLWRNDKLNGNEKAWATEKCE